MAYDRTAEFAAAAESFHFAANPPAADPRQPFSDADKNFNLIASDMGNSLHATSLKLQELAKLARQCGIYNDKTAQIQELTFEIRKTINTLNCKVDTLEKAAAAAGVSGQSKQHYITVTEVLKTRLLDVTKEFKDILMLRTENLKRQDKRRNLYSFGGDSGTAEAEEMYDIEGGQRTTLVSRPATAYSQARAEAVENVQRVIGELASIFQRVATMIAHQEEMIQRIDQDIDTSMYHIREGQNELLNFYNRISSNRSLIIKARQHISLAS
ncbi:syntaxin, putative [Eimeria necatrix]|uniref:Syntaxin, putative n=1 Tax=Eimeria necatrix TaxID=51315 RepID=U6N2L5_9EIME|nr:syntaxin, putative [Eimeria necatrix]CDJ69004.1 syntaxin, putative [Eimeria necatrix]